jgi:hypothetical protein
MIESSSTIKVSLLLIPRSFKVLFWVDSLVSIYFGGKPFLITNAYLTKPIYLIMIKYFTYAYQIQFLTFQEKHRDSFQGSHH